MQERPVGVDVARMVAGEELEREQRRPPASRALVLEASAKQLELLAEAKLPDRPVGNCALAVVRAARGRFELLVPLRPQLRKLAL